MTHRAGRVGQVDCAAEVTGCYDWTLKYSVATKPTTDFESAGTSDHLPTISDWSGSFKCWKDGVPLTLGTSATPVTIKLYETQEVNEFWTGSCFVTDINAGLPHDGLSSYDYTFLGTGTLTPAAA